MDGARTLPRHHGVRYWRSSQYTHTRWHRNWTGAWKCTGGRTCGAFFSAADGDQRMKMCWRRPMTLDKPKRVGGQCCARGRTGVASSWEWCGGHALTRSGEAVGRGRRLDKRWWSRCNTDGQGRGAQLLDIGCGWSGRQRSRLLGVPHGRSGRSRGRGHDGKYLYSFTIVNRKTVMLVVRRLTEANYRTACTPRDRFHTTRIYLLYTSINFLFSAGWFSITRLALLLPRITSIRCSPMPFFHCALVVVAGGALK
jgi:hypothetical protein